MKLSEEGGIISDSGHTILLKFKEDGPVEGWQHSLASLPEEDRDMFARPEEVWEEFFRQPTQDDV